MMIQASILSILQLVNNVYTVLFIRRRVSLMIFFAKNNTTQVAGSHFNFQYLALDFILKGKIGPKISARNCFWNQVYFPIIPGRKTHFLDIEILKCNFVRLLNLAQDAAIIIIRKLKYGSMKNNQISIIFSLHSVFSVA